MRWLALLALLLFPAHAHAQATVVSSCGSVTYTAGTPHNVTIDTNGQSCQVGAAPPTATLFLYTGESNSGGAAPNAGLPPAELVPFPLLQILNNSTLTLQPMQINVNNLLGHQALVDNTYHGSELGWGEAINAGRVSSTPVFLLKAGQGGSQISDWTTSSSCGYWATLVSRYNTTIAAIHALGYPNVNTVVMYSQGLNDMAGTDTNSTCHPSPAVIPVATWVTATQAYFATQLRPLVGATAPIIMSKFDGSIWQSSGIGGGIDTITAADSLTTSFTGDPTLWILPEGVHRTDAGYRNWAEFWLDNWLRPNGTAPVPAISPAAGNFTPSVTVTITPSGGEDVYYSTDGNDPLTNAVKYTAPFTIATPVAVKARGILPNKASSTVVTNSYTNPSVNPVWSSSDATANSMTLTNGGLTVAATTATFASIRGTTSHATGKYYVEFKCVAGSGSAQGYGMASASFNPASYLSTSSHSGGFFDSGGGTIGSAGFTPVIAQGGYAPIAGDVFKIAVDFDAGKMWLGANSSGWGSSDPATGAGPWMTFAAPALGQAYFAAMSLTNGGGTWTLQSTSLSQTYPAPAGFSPWN